LRSGQSKLRAREAGRLELEYVGGNEVRRSNDLKQTCYPMLSYPAHASMRTIVYIMPPTATAGSVERIQLSYPFRSQTVYLTSGGRGLRNRDDRGSSSATTARGLKSRRVDRRHRGCTGWHGNYMYIDQFKTFTDVSTEPISPSSRDPSTPRGREVAHC
jgi:hypothetical protein